MLIIGAKGFAKEILEICYQNKELENLAFYDDVNSDIGNFLYDKFPIIHNLKEAEDYFKTIDNRFTIGIGNPILRRKMCEVFERIGGIITSTVSNTATIGHFDVVIEDGGNIMQRVVITNSVVIQKGTIINQLTSIGHDVLIKQFVEICPNVSISGNCIIGENTFIGTGAIILPDITIGKNVIIGAGSVVTQGIPDNCTVVGIPAKIIKKNNEFTKN